MPTYLSSVAAATAIVGYDLFTGQPWARSPEDRTIEGIGFKGSAAAGDTVADLYVDETRIGTFSNTNTGIPNNDDLLEQDSLFVPAGALLRFIVTDAPVTNPINTLLQTEEL